MLSEDHIQALAQIERHLLQEHPVLSILVRRFEPRSRRDAPPFPAAVPLLVVGLLLMIVFAVLTLPTASMIGARLSLSGLGLHMGREHLHRRRLRDLGDHGKVTRGRPAPEPHGHRQHGPA